MARSFGSRIGLGVFASCFCGVVSYLVRGLGARILVSVLMWYLMFTFCWYRFWALSPVVDEFVVRRVVNWYSGFVCRVCLFWVCEACGTSCQYIGLAVVRIVMVSFICSVSGSQTRRDSH